MRILLAAVLVLAAAPAAAEPATAPFAGAQLEAALRALEHARAARALGDVAAARRYAAQAELDARLVWSMTESRYLRRAAAEVGREVARIRFDTVVSSRHDP